MIYLIFWPISGTKGRQFAGALVQKPQRDAGQHEGPPDAHLDPGQGGLQVQALRESAGALKGQIDPKSIGLYEYMYLAAKCVDM